MISEGGARGRSLHWPHSLDTPPAHELIAAAHSTCISCYRFHTQCIRTSTDFFSLIQLIIADRRVADIV